MAQPANASQARTTAATGSESRRFERECICFFEEALQVFGVPRSVAQIYGLLYASPSPLSFSDIVERLGISKGSASQGLQLLRALGAIRVATSAGLLAFPGRAAAVPESPRREYYEPELSLRKLVSGVLQERIAPLAASGAEHLTRLRSMAAEADEGGEFYQQRVKQLETWRRRLRTVLPVLGALLGPKGK
jgi:HTH-type transcriptional regulator, glycine betaine synthesis regulator